MAYEYLSQEGYDKVKNELEVLKSEGRRKAAQAIAEARAQGDLSENAEYDAAKDAQGLLELKINKLEKVFANARVLSTKDLDTSKAVVFSKVTVTNLANKKVFTYQLVSETEANLKERKISVTSPIGAGFLGKKVGEVAEIKTPRGVMKFKVTNISF